jgi:hypothetical protein
MIIDPNYGPQFDPSDGTIGPHQLVRRWVIEDKPGNLFYRPWGEYTFATQDDCQTRIAEFQSNPTNDPKLVEGLEAAEWWCAADCFEPRYKVEE